MMALLFFMNIKTKICQGIVIYKIFGSIEQLFGGGQLHFKVFSCYHTIHDLLLFILCVCVRTKNAWQKISVEFRFSNLYRRVLLRMICNSNQKKFYILNAYSYKCSFLHCLSSSSATIDISALTKIHLNSSRIYHDMPSLVYTIKLQHSRQHY